MFNQWLRFLGSKAPRFEIAGKHGGSKKRKTTPSERRALRKRRQRSQNRNRYAKSSMWKVGIR